MTMPNFLTRTCSQLLLLSLFAASAFAGPALRADDWIVLAPAGEGFSIKVPVKPEVESQRVPVMGNTYQLRLYTMTDDKTGLLYMVIMQEYPSITGVLNPTARLEKFMDGFKKGLGESLAAAVGGKFDLVPDRDLKVGTSIGRQYKITVGETHGLVRGFDGGRRVYLLLVLGADESSAAASSFFDSFEIRPAPDPVPQPIAPPDPRQQPSGF
jgi:hypothetical protein